MTTLFDAGDFQRLDRERTLTEQAPRQLPVEDRSPIEDDLDVLTVRDEPDFDGILDGLLAALKARLRNVE